MEDKLFIDRKEELKQLNDALNRTGPELIIIYGRRRIGKTRLLNQIKTDILVMLEETDYSSNVKKMAEAVSIKYNYPSFNPQSFTEIFKNIPEKQVISLDEFSYLSGFGEFQAIWEEICKKKWHKLILCGSLIRVMEDLNYSLKSPLYGRATQIVKVMPLSFPYVVEWYEKREIAEIMQTYFCVGGIPRYLEVITKPYLLDIENAFGKNGLLLREGKLLIKENFPSSILFPKILSAISNGITEATKIANFAEIKSSQISKYLSVLIDYGYIEKRFPVLGGGKKDARFYLADKFFAFWSRFIWPFYSEIENGKPIDLGEKLNAYFGVQFENLVIEIAHGLFTDMYDKAGRQWQKDVELDLVCTNEKHNAILFGECKWQDNVNPEAIMALLRQKAKQILWNNETRTEKYAVFAKSFKKRIEGKEILLFDLKDIEKKISV
ncbi:MAG: ATP-binding protein [archaeon]